MSQTGKTSKLDPYRDEIVALRRQRKTYQDIVRHLAKEHGLRVALSTLSTYLDAAMKGSGQTTAPTAARSTRPAPPPVSPVSPEQENFLAQAEVFAELQTSMRMVVDKLGELIDGVRAMNREGQQRHDNVVAAFRSLRDQSGGKGELPAEIRDSLTRQETALRKLTERGGAAAATPLPRMPADTTRRIWTRALTVTGVGWALLGGVILAYLS